MTSDGDYEGFHHLGFVVANAMQAADWYVLKMGFSRIAYSGLNNGSRQVASHAIRLGKITLVFSSPLNPDDSALGRDLIKHGDAVKDIAFSVKNCRKMHQLAVERGAKSVSSPHIISDKDGSVTIASVQTFGDVVHSFVERGSYGGIFLPGFTAVERRDPAESFFQGTGLEFVDHVVGNQPYGQSDLVCKWYEDSLKFHKFWSVDESVIYTEYSSLRTTIMRDESDQIQLVINEPTIGKRKNQVQEFVDYNGGPGVQHIARHTQDIIRSVAEMKKRGLRFLRVPATYYQMLRQKLAHSSIEIEQDLARLEELDILVDFDDSGYLLQLFTKPAQDRPTLFFEIIQRHGHKGFGAGNIKSLFEAVEKEQELRGNL
eukprot:TRINITY_DN8324_c0_g1_i1.p1 TRINITY_DN8324_c0_g1~~TRINITY_DN8324_c0_g1_i1.p1  ORF type:complete len:373 (-),score=131.86 TRINITY_DN8324_c0_g1_i1:35-1153(-)